MLELYADDLDATPLASFAVASSSVAGIFAGRFDMRQLLCPFQRDQANSEGSSGDACFHDHSKTEDGVERELKVAAKQGKQRWRKRLRAVTNGG